MKSKDGLVSGIGFNDANYDVGRYELVGGKKIKVWACPIYTRWTSMLQRCYHPPCQMKHPTYIGCSVVDEWHLFSAFKSWVEKQDWAGKELDKDLLVRGNRIYGPEYCTFISRPINCLVRESIAPDERWPKGVVFYEKRRKYRSSAYCFFERKKIHLGYFDTPGEAHANWLNFKNEQAKQLAAQQTDDRVAKAIANLYQSFGV